MVEWYADLTEPAAARGDTSTAQPRDIGRVTVTVDFPHQTVTFHTVIKDLVGLRRIEVRADGANGDVRVPAIFTIYEAHEGRFEGTSTRTVEGPAFTSVATPILNSGATIAIATDAHPDGEVVGQIVMHKHYE
jgi:CHRD domain